MIRTVGFIIALIITLALTLTTWLIPDPVEELILELDQKHPDVKSLPALAYSAAEDQLFIDELSQPKQFIVVSSTKKSEEKSTVQRTVIKSQDAVIPPTYIEPPTPPNLIYTGQMIDASGFKKVFLTFEDQTLVLSQGDIVSQRWKIKSIQENQIMIFDQISNQLFVLNI